MRITSNDPPAAPTPPAPPASTPTPTPEPTPSVCYVTGTRIRVLRGLTICDVPVERLRVGDLAITASGKPRPIRWIGHRLTRCHGHPRPREVMPVRIAAHALGPSRPARDLWLSGGHAIAVDATGTPEAEHGAVLAPAEAFINGATITQVAVPTVTYWHVELDSHDLLIAEGVAAESYLDMGNRAFFGDGPVVALHASPDSDPAARTHAAFCRPYRNGGAAVDAERARVHAQALALGWSLERDLWAGAHLMVDGRRVPAQIDGETARFRLPASARAVWLVSNASVPLHVGYAPDARLLGLALTGLRLEDGRGAAREIALDDPRLGEGFHGIDGAPGDAWRWTAGRARLPSLWAGCTGEVMLTVSVRDIGLPRWRTPKAETVAAARRQPPRP